MSSYLISNQYSNDDRDDDAFQEGCPLYEEIYRDTKRLGMTDMDAYLVWKLGIQAFSAARSWGAKFPSDVDDAPCCNRPTRDCDCDPKSP